MRLQTITSPVQLISPEPPVQSVNRQLPEAPVQSRRHCAPPTQATSQSVPLVQSTLQEEPAGQSNWHLAGLFTQLNSQLHPL